MFKFIRFLYSINYLIKPIKPIEGKHFILPVFAYTNYTSYLLYDENVKQNVFVKKTLNY